MHRILIVEDEKNQRELYESVMEEEGYLVDTAANGKDALCLAKKNKYDLVIMDIKMPEMDGIEAMREMLTVNKTMPVIIYTSYSQYKSNFLTWMADAYITKSSDMEEIKEKVRTLLNSSLVKEKP